MKCFQYSITVTLHYREIGKHDERIANIKPLIDKYKWEKNKVSIRKRWLEKY